MPWLENRSLLVVGANAGGRNGLEQRLGEHGCTCLATASYDGAVILVSRRRATYALLEYIGTSSEVASVVSRLRKGTPSILLIGTSAEDRRVAFAEAGVSEYLPQPWSFEQLRQQLRGRIGPCVDCGLDLPLRRPAFPEHGLTWVCGGCGARYLAMLDEHACANTRLNARPE